MTPTNTYSMPLEPTTNELTLASGVNVPTLAPSTGMRTPRPTSCAIPTVEVGQSVYRCQIIVTDDHLVIVRHETQGDQRYAVGVPLVPGAHYRAYQRINYHGEVSPGVNLYITLPEDAPLPEGCTVLHETWTAHSLVNDLERDLPGLFEVSETEETPVPQCPVETESAWVVRDGAGKVMGSWPSDRGLAILRAWQAA